MKRNPRKERWTKAYRRLHYKDMTQGQDGTFEFEWKRNRPERESLAKGLAEMGRFKVQNG
nr:hypothetical protein [Tanacetum cinerariifolium]GEZ45209.1 hypothetical protein [Tanacetum cinerariifolium]